MDGYERISDSLVYFMFAFIVFCATTFIMRYIRWVRAKDNVGQRLYQMKREFNYSAIVWSVLMLFRIYEDYRWSKIVGNEEIDPSISEVFKFINTQEYTLKVTYLAIIVVLVMFTIDFLLSVPLRSTIYNEGIIVNSGKFIPWEDIQRIEYREVAIGNSKRFRIYTSPKRFEEALVKISEIDKVIEIISRYTNVDIFEVNVTYIGDEKES
ncbi:hypothetical protein [Clostridium cylindrosporum]|uniref:Uncharacterized protein n=1 Tax=Clostridium cylindrosporum DSM 605 TaxID=1121307 RepID=A0A0J8DGL8_CLOCY|nr:hypothetical protein [Clostridium cylindrosporum]KMT23369.1 hypothetical protein CLCY_8c01060 [Clostridium cylindrosporum DSM 605]